MARLLSHLETGIPAEGQDEAAFPELWDSLEGLWLPGHIKEGDRAFNWADQRRGFQSPTIGALTNMDPPTDWVPGDMGWVLDFEGDSAPDTGDRVKIPSDFPNLVDDWSIAMRINPDTISRGGGNDQYALWSRWTDSSTGRELYWYITSSPNDKFQVDIPFVKAIMSSNASAVAGAWQHLCLTKKGSVWTLYIDGVEDNQVTDATAQENGPAVEFGFSFEAPGRDPFDGRMGRVSAYSRALDADTVHRLARDPLYYPLTRRARRGVFSFFEAAASDGEILDALHSGGAQIAVPPFFRIASFWSDEFTEELAAPAPDIVEWESLPDRMRPPRPLAIDSFGKRNIDPIETAAFDQQLFIHDLPGELFPVPPLGGTTAFPAVRGSTTEDGWNVQPIGVFWGTDDTGIPGGDLVPPPPALTEHEGQGRLDPDPTDPLAEFEFHPHADTLLPPPPNLLPSIYADRPDTGALQAFISQIPTWSGWTDELIVGPPTSAEHVANLDPQPQPDHRLMEWDRWCDELLPPGPLMVDSIWPRYGDVATLAAQLTDVAEYVGHVDTLLPPAPVMRDGFAATPPVEVIAEFIAQISTWGRTYEDLAPPPPELALSFLGLDPAEQTDHRLMEWWTWIDELGPPAARMLDNVSRGEFTETALQVVADLPTWSGWTDFLADITPTAIANFHARNIDPIEETAFDQQLFPRDWADQLFPPPPDFAENVTSRNLDPLADRGLIDWPLDIETVEPPPPVHPFVYAEWPPDWLIEIQDVPVTAPRWLPHADLLGPPPPFVIDTFASIPPVQGVAETVALLFEGQNDELLPPGPAGIASYKTDPDTQALGEFVADASTWIGSRDELLPPADQPLPHVSTLPAVEVFTQFVAELPTWSPGDSELFPTPPVAAETVATGPIEPQTDQRTMNWERWSDQLLPLPTAGIPGFATDPSTQAVADFVATNWEATVNELLPPPANVIPNYADWVDMQWLANRVIAVTAWSPELQKVIPVPPAPLPGTIEYGDTFAVAAAYQPQTFVQGWRDDLIPPPLQPLDTFAGLPFVAAVAAVVADVSDWEGHTDRLLYEPPPVIDSVESYETLTVLVLPAIVTTRFDLVGSAVTVTLIGIDSKSMELDGSSVTHTLTGK